MRPGNHHVSADFERTESWATKTSTACLPSCTLSSKYVCQRFSNIRKKKTWIEKIKSEPVALARKQATHSYRIWGIAQPGVSPRFIPLLSMVSLHSRILLGNCRFSEKNWNPITYHLHQDPPNPYGSPCRNPPFPVRKNDRRRHRPRCPRSLRQWKIHHFLWSFSQLKSSIDRICFPHILLTEDKLAWNHDKDPIKSPWKSHSIPYEIPIRWNSTL